jgi:multidrug efflux pump subunit AcrB
MVMAIGVTIASLGMVVGGRVPFVFISSSDAETVNVALRMPTGTPIDQTDAIVRRIEELAIAEPEISAVFAVVGATNSMDGESSAQNPHIAQLVFELIPVEARDRSSEEIILDIRSRLGDLPGVKSLRMEEVSGGPEGPDISLTVTGDAPERIARAATLLKQELAGYDGVFDIADDADAGQRELRIEVLESGSALGFTTEGLARQLRGAVYGLEAYTFAGDREDIDVRVMLPVDVRRSIADIEGLWIFTPKGTAVPLREIARITETDGYSSVHRFNRKRAITVSADVDTNMTNTEEVMANFKSHIQRIETEIPGVRVIERGRQKDVADSFRTLPIGFATAIGLNFVILAWLFSSYLQPLVILTAVPFSIVGVVWGHLLLGYDMTFLSLIGFIALTGVVVNDSIVFMDFYNDSHRNGVPIFNALIEAGRQRLRAILLTTITTVLGLAPLIAEQSFQAKFLIPMAITISFGLMSATVLILITLPCLLLIGHDIRRVAKRLWYFGLNPWSLRPPAAGTPRTLGSSDRGSGPVPF